MKRIALLMTIIPSILAILVLGSCNNDTVWDDIPYPITKFISQYFPGQDASSFTSNDEIYHVKLKNGPGMTFNSKFNWTDINGYGERLPQVLLFDQLPPALYEYLQTGELQSDAISIERTTKQYIVVLIDTTVYFDIQTSKITQGGHLSLRLISRRNRNSDSSKGNDNLSIASCSMVAYISLLTMCPRASYQIRS